MPGGQAVGGAVKADVKGSFAVVDDLADLFLVGHLGDQAAGFQFFVDLHIFPPWNGGKEQNKTPPAKREIWQRAKKIAVPPLFARSSRQRAFAGAADKGSRDTQAL